jgi:hypothetical protein
MFLASDNMMLRKRDIANNLSYENDKEIEIEIEIEKENTIMFDSSYQVVVICFQYVYKSIKIFINISGIYLLWICLHYLASHLYVRLCVPNTIVGFLISPFMTATPHCQGLRWVVYNAASIINNMWIVLGTWICSTLLINPLLEKVKPN